MTNLISSAKITASVSEIEALQLPIEYYHPAKWGNIQNQGVYSMTKKLIRFLACAMTAAVVLGLSGCNASLPLMQNQPASLAPNTPHQTTTLTNIFADIKAPITVNPTALPVDLQPQARPSAEPTQAPAPMSEPTVQPAPQATPTPALIESVDPRIGQAQLLLSMITPGNGRELSACLSRTEYQSFFEQHKLQGLYPTYVQADLRNGGACYRAVMEALPTGIHAEYRHGQYQAAFQGDNSRLTAQGYQLEHHQVLVGPDGAELHQAIWYLEQPTTQQAPIAQGPTAPAAEPVSDPASNRTTAVPDFPAWAIRLTQVDDRAAVYVNKQRVIEALWGHRGINGQAQYVAHVPGDSELVDLTPYLKSAETNYIRVELENFAECCGTGTVVELYKDGVFVAKDIFHKDDSSAGIKNHWLIQIDERGNLTQFQTFLPYGDMGLPPEY